MTIHPRLLNVKWGERNVAMVSVMHLKVLHTTVIKFPETIDLHPLNSKQVILFLMT
jgi:hypothetical protein